MSGHYYYTSNVIEINRDNDWWWEIITMVMIILTPKINMSGDYCVMIDVNSDNELYSEYITRKRDL